MGTLLASTLINKAATVLTDINGIEWNRGELLGWLCDAQRTVAGMAPSAANVTAAVALAAGTRQSIPPNGWSLLDIYRNMGSNGATPGRAIRVVSKRHLDLFNPDWHTAFPVANVTEYLFDPNDQTKFWVNPPSDGTGFVEVNYATVPPEISDETQPIGLNDVFEPILLDYILYRACAKKADYSPGMEMAAKYRAAFDMAMTAKVAAEQMSNPNRTITRAPPVAQGGDQ